MEAVVMDGPQVMTLEEARHCVNEIKRGMFDIRYLVLDLHQREGWRALGYKNWQECKEREFDESARHIERLLTAAQIEQNIRPIEHTTSWSYSILAEPVPESQLRPLTGLQPDIQRQVWTQAVATAPEGKVTAAHVERTVAKMHGEASFRAGVAKKVIEDDGDVPATVTLRTARVVYLMTMGNWYEIDEVAELTGLSINGAWRLLDRLAGGHHVPITECDGKWGILRVEPEDMPY